VGSSNSKVIYISNNLETIQKEKKMTFTLSDKSIASIVNLLQVGIITGTDIVDQLRTMELVVEDGNLLSPSETFIKNFNENVEKMIEEATRFQNAANLEC